MKKPHFLHYFRLIWPPMTETGSRNFIPFLDKILQTYNSRPHRMLGQKSPIFAEKNPTNAYTVGDISSWAIGRYWCKMACFQRAWQRVKVLSRLESLLIPIKLDQTFKMRYSMSLNSHWIQKYQPSKLNNQRKRPFYYQNGRFFQSFNFDG